MCLYIAKRTVCTLVEMFYYKNLPYHEQQKNAMQYKKFWENAQSVKNCRR